MCATLMEDASFAGWGVRTVAAGERRYNPLSYHNGSVWPHDNALIAAGLARYGFTGAARRILTAMFDLSEAVDLHRLPELICGFPRRGREYPDPVSGRLRAAGLGGRRRVPAACRCARRADRRRRGVASRFHAGGFLKRSTGSA